jgi:hypothetical protein
MNLPEAPDAQLRLLLAVVGAVGLLYVWVGSGMMQKGHREWWDGLPRVKRVVFVVALTATVVQFLL